MMHVKRIRIVEHLLQINFFLAVRTNLFLANNAPASNTKFMKNMIAAKLICIFQNALFMFRN